MTLINVAPIPPSGCILFQESILTKQRVMSQRCFKFEWVKIVKHREMQHEMKCRLRHVISLLIVSRDQWTKIR